MEKEKYQEMSPEEIKKFEEENMTDTEKEMSEKKASKFEQREQMPPILIIYRDNDLFEKYVPEIERMLTAQGRRIEVKNFPRGTDKNEIKEWYKENSEQLAGAEIISDRTAASPHSQFEELIFEAQGTSSKGNLDALISKVIKKAIWGERVDNKTSSFPSEEEFYSGIMKRILENQENIPNKIYLFSDHITDHVDIKNYTEIGPGDDKDLYQYIQFGEIPPVINKEILEHYKKKREEVIAKCSEEIKKSFIQSGIDVEKIIIKSDRPSEQELQEIDQPNNWVIIDRHSQIFNERNKLVFAKKFSLPSGNFYDNVREAGLIDIPEKEFNQNLEKVLDEELGS